jgi:glutamyl-tRNA synthetase
MLRFAPSPTGDMHIGNLKVALLNFIVATQRGEKFIIRIEDTDSNRNISGKDQEILELLDIFGISYDEVIYQSSNIKFHQQLATKLLIDKHAFNCFCSSEDLDRKKLEAKESKKPYRYDESCKKLPDEFVIDNENPFLVRIKKPIKTIEFNDHIKGRVSFEPNDIDDFVILRVDKSPTYNFACAVDDMLSDISLIIRGEDHLSNTPKQIAIRDSLGYKKDIEYAHLPIILNDLGKKMSKRDSASSVQWLLQEGFLPSAIINYLLMIGYKTPCEIFTLDEATKWYDISKVSKSSAKFDLNQLRSINRAHINKTDSLKLSSLIGYKSSDIGNLAKLYSEEASTINEIKDKIDKIFSKKEPDEFIKEFEVLKEVIKSAPHFDKYSDFKDYLIQKSTLNGQKLFKPLRVLLSGAKAGPNISDIYEHIKNYIKEVAR